MRQQLKKDKKKISEHYFKQYIYSPIERLERNTTCITIVLWTLANNSILTYCDNHLDLSNLADASQDIDLY